MSLDYPLYEEMVRRGSRAAPWWRVGDSLYYIGLLIAMLAIPAGVVHAVLSHSVLILLWYLLALILGVVIYSVGVIFKGRSYLLAERDGIDPSKY